MYLESHRNFIKKCYEEYKKIGYVKCPAFGYEKVYFNRHGFRHLIRKGKKFREINEQIERLNLLKYASMVIDSSKHFKDYNKNKMLAIKDQDESADFWSFIKIHNNVKIIAVVRQIKNGPKHFFSIMYKKHKRPRRVFP